MKVIILCGDFSSEDEAQGRFYGPMVDIVERPVIWHVMNQFARYGYKDFIICLDFERNPIKDYFLAEEITTGLKDSVKAWAGNAWDLGVWGNAQAAGSSVYGFFSGANSAAMKKLITERKIGVGVGITALSFLSAQVR